MIIDLLGYPTEEELEMFNDIKDKDLLKSIIRKEKQDFNVVFKGLNPKAISLLK